MRILHSGLLPALAAASANPLPLAAQEVAEPATPDGIVAGSHADEWTRIDPADLLVMDLAPDAKGSARRVVIQLMPAPFSQGWVDNIRKLTAARWFDGVAVVRVQDNYVVQWGDPEGEDPAKAKRLPEGLKAVPQSAYTVPVSALIKDFHLRTYPDAIGYDLRLGRDPYGNAFFQSGWPLSGDGQSVAPVHCYGMVGVGRNLSPDTGTGAELYTVIGHAPRQLDRNIALVGRIIAGMAYLSSLPRGTGELGFYENAAERTPIVRVRMGDETADLPPYEYLSTNSPSFAAYAAKRANRKDAFYIQPAGGVDVCNVPVPVRVAGKAIKRAGM